MQLKSVEIQGFKSFPDRTVITFSKGITGIVGPNGSGKSNISDAIRWVMGETSAKSLRGNKIEDVIFDGTSNRKPLGYAEVSMILGNADRTLDLPYDDVIITRRYYRSGESEYFINGAAVRLKDIQDLLRDTGLGKTGYSVIGQGAITEIIEAKSVERRVLFEEASGISGYRHKKEESLRKLEQTRANLARLNDIIFELKERLGPLERQSANAKKYLSLRDEKKELEITLWVRRLAQIEEGLKQAQIRVEIFAGDLERTEKDIASKEEAIVAAEQEAERLTALVESVRNDVRTHEEFVREKQTQIVVAQNDIEHLEKDIDRIKLSITDNENEKKRSEVERAEKLAEKESLAEKILLQEQKTSAKKDEIELSEKRLEDAEAEIERCEKAVATVADGITGLQVRLSALKQSIESGEEYAESRLREIEDAKKRVEEFRTARRQTKEALEKNEEELDSCKNMQRGYLLKKNNLATRQEALDKKLTDTRILLGEKENRLNILSGMEAHYDGFQNSVRTVMEEAKRGVLRGIEGTVSDLITVKDEYSVAIETALGNMLQNIVTTDDKCAKNAIFLLKNRNSGRATFLPLNTIRGTVLKVNGLEKEDGFVGVASDLVSADGKYAEIVRSLLGRTAVAEDLDAATEIAKKNQYAFRIVTLDGQVVNAGGSLTGGSLNKNFGFLSRRNEIEALKKESASVRADLEKMVAENKNSVAEISAVNASLTGLDAEIRNLEEQHIKLQGEIEHFRSFEDNLAKQEEQLNEELAGLASAKDKNAQEQELIDGKLKQGEADLAKANDEKTKADERYEQLRREREELIEQCHAEELAQVELRKTAETVAFDILRLEQSELMRVGDVKKLEENIAALQRQIEDLKKKSEEYEKEKTEADVKVKVAAETIQMHIASRMTEEQKVQKLRADEKELYALREQIVRENEKQSSALQGFAAERDTIVSKIWEEYEYTVSEAETHCIEIDDFKAAEEKVNSIKAQMKSLGNVNLDAIDEYLDVKNRYEDMTAQVADLESAGEKLEKLIDELTGTMRSAFVESFGVINETFQSVFKELFDGGHAELRLEDPENVLESGIEILAAPPGKIIKNLMALSGGERALTAIALYFAILKIRPAPFCLLDEIEAALDEVNVVRYARYLQRSEKTQFIVITHRRGTMEHADTLYGVTMKEKGISKILSVNIDEAAKHLQEGA